MDVEFEDLYYSPRFDLNWIQTWNKDTRLNILKGVSGCFRAGELSAILGPSGAGKTTLLNLLSGYKASDGRGRLLVNGVVRDERKFRKMSCYITQEDHLRARLTLDELMWFAASLKLPSGYHSSDKRNVVIEVQKKIGLYEARNTETQRLSGGQKKRLSIALELINNPPVLFLDEPTSGLDNVAAACLIRLLSSLSRGGKTIICTIHQPSATLFSLFDQSYFVVGGKCVYRGGSGAHLLEFLEANHFPCPEYYNPADFVIELVEEEKNVEILCRTTENGRVAWYSKNVQIQGKDTSAVYNNETKLLQHGVLLNKEQSQCCNPEKMSLWIQFTALLSCMLLQQKRNKVNLRIQIGQSLGCGLAVGLLAYQRGNNGTEFINCVNFCFGILLYHTYTHLMVPILSYPMEVKMVKKEHFNQWYKLLPYYMAYTVSRAPFFILLPQLFLTIVYLLAGLPLQLHRFLAFSLISIMTSIVAEGFGLTIGSIFSVTNGTAVGPMSLAPTVGFAIYGFDFARSISPFMAALVRTSFLRAGFTALILAFFGLDREPLECDDPVYCHFSNPQAVLHFLGLDDKSYWTYALDLFLLLVLFRFTFYFALKWRMSS